METKFQKWLKNELIQRNMIQAELARRANVSRSAINRLLSERRMPSYDMCQSIADAFEIPVENVYRAAELLPPVHPEDELIAKILYEVEQMSLEEKKELADYARFMITKRSKKNVGSTLVTVE